VSAGAGGAVAGIRCAAVPSLTGFGFKSSQLPRTSVPGCHTLPLRGWILAKPLS